MAEEREWRLCGYDGGDRAARTWSGTAPPRYVALLCHGYGEHMGRYPRVAEHFVGHGAVVYGVDHVGHGRSAGERALIGDFERVVDDFHALDLAARAEHPGLPVVLVGHSMGGMIAARYAQRYGDTLAALVLSGPVIGSWEPVTSLLTYEEIPETPIDVSTLSRDDAVGRAYAADPLVWHGPFKRPTVAAFARCLETINAGPGLGGLPTLWAHGGADELVPVEPSRAGVERIRGDRLTARIHPGARHEIFNETNAAAVLGEVTAFVDQVLDGIR